MDWYTVMMNRLQTDVLREAEHDQLVQMALDSRPEKSPGWFGQMMSGLGGGLISVGRYLQNRYETCENTTVAVSKNMDY